MCVAAAHRAVPPAPPQWPCPAFVAIGTCSSSVGNSHQADNNNNNIEETSLFVWCFGPLQAP